MKKPLCEQLKKFTVKKVNDFPVPSRDVPGIIKIFLARES
jgi:hypothetical protein